MTPGGPLPTEDVCSLVGFMTNDEELTDLIASARLGDRLAMDLLLRASRAALSVRATNTIPETLQARIDPSDVIQDVLLEANNDFASFEGKSSLEWKAWLRRVLANNIIECLRRHIDAEKRSVHREQSENRHRSEWFVADGATPGECVALEELAGWLAAFQAQLPEESQTVLKLRFWDGLSLSQIAATVGLSKASASRLLRKSLLLLHESVAERIEPDDLF